MPLPDNDYVNKLADKTVETMRKRFDTPKNYRPVHAKGQLCRGTFTPNSAARYLSKAPIFTTASTQIICRFSTDTGYKDLPDNDFLEQFEYQIRDDMDGFLAKHPHAKYFQENQAPLHAYSFATEQWYATHAYKFVSPEGKERFFRWRFVPWQGVMKHSAADASKQSKNFQFDDLKWRMENNKPIKYRLLAQLAEEGDPTDDSTKTWPETNEFVEMGEVVIDGLWGKKAEGETPEESLDRPQQRIIFDPMPRQIEGIENGNDALVQLRTSVYLKSGQIRREANGVTTKPEDYATGRCPFLSM